MSELKLKNCPFCGSPARVVLDYQDIERWAQCTKRKPESCVLSTAIIEIAKWNRRTQPEAAKAASTVGELPPPDYIAGTKGMLCENAWSRETVEAYGQACAEAAWNNCATLNQERIRQLTDAEAARQPAPVVVKPWETRMQEYFAQGSVKMRTPASFMADEIIDSRAALAATAAPVGLLQELLDAYRQMANSAYCQVEADEELTSRCISALAATRSQS